MGRTKSNGSNATSHLINRQFGNDIDKFRANLFRERMAMAKNMYCTNLVAHFGCINAIEFSADGELLISGGDDQRVLLWKLEESMAGITQPRSMKNQHYSNIFCLAFNNDCSKIFSGGNDEALIVHDTKTGEPYGVFTHAKAVYGVSVDTTNDQIFTTACDDGQVLVFDLRIGTQVLVLAKSRASFHAVEFHPMDGNLAITGNERDGAALWDLREYTRPLVQFGGLNNAQSFMSVRFNSHGSQVLALRRRLPPILYSTYAEEPICQFYHSNYFNSCTMKSCTFAGEDDEYVVSGSDDFNLYIWRVADANCDKTNQWIDSHHMVLHGHRSIVNQVRYNAQKCLLASSGVEKVIKLWRPFELEGWTGGLEADLTDRVDAREIFSYEEQLALFNASGQHVSHDYTEQSTSEDPRMMAFFDTLVQREIEEVHCDDDDSFDSDKRSQHSSDGSSRPTSTLQSESDSTTSLQIRRRGEFGNYGMLGRNFIGMKAHSKYVNRIAYLIATKRNILKRLALKGSVRIKRRVKSSLNGANRKLQQRLSARSSRRSTGKRMHRHGRRHRTRDCNGNNSDGELPKNIAKRRNYQHMCVPPFRSNRRISKVQYYANHESLDSSSDDDSLSDTGNPSSSKPIGQGTSHVIESPPQSPTRFPIPSTSTGITGNGPLFRIAQTPDSDDDPTPRNSPPLPRAVVNTVPIKINGNHTHKKAVAATETPSVAYSSGVDDEQPSEIRHSRRKRNHSLTSTYHYADNLSSHSSSRLSDSSSSDDDDATSNDDSSTPFFRNANSLTKRLKTPFGESHAQQFIERTPMTNRTRDHKDYDCTPDSGIAVTPCPSSSGLSTSHNLNKHFSDGNNNSNRIGTSISGACASSSSRSRINGDESLTTSMKLFQQSLSRIRRNFRNIGDASFSEDSD